MLHAPVCLEYSKTGILSEHAKSLFPFLVEKNCLESLSLYFDQEAQRSCSKGICTAGPNFGSPVVEE